MFQTDLIELTQNSEEDDFHRLSLQLSNGRFQLVVDCVQVANGEFELQKLVDRWGFFEKKFKSVYKFNKNAV